MASYTDREQGFWVNEPIDEPLGIVRKYYPWFLAPYKHDMLYANKHSWVQTACLCTDGKYYVFDRYGYSKWDVAHFNKQCIGPFDALDAAMFAAATIDQREL